MILFLIVEISIILASLIIVSEHIGLANKFLIGTFFIILFAVTVYLIGLFTNEKK